MKYKFTLHFIKSILLFSLLTLISCSDGNLSSGSNDTEITIVEYDDTDFEPTDWTEATHSNDVDPNYDEVFEDNTVKRIDIVVDSERWEAMLSDMYNLYGSFGTSSRPGGITDSDEDPIFVPAEVFYKDTEWYRVGIRFKGNSSLQSSWSAGIMKLSFKLDFDEFEDTYPQIKNQRFYGFKKMSLKNNYNDESMIREKVSSDIFRNAGVAASQTAFYTLYVDYGEGPQYFGVYTLVEEVDDTVIDTQFSNNDGNLYKPDGTGASFASGTFSEDVFEKKTNEDLEDWSDIESLFTALHADNRTSDPESWRENLDSVFDTDTFLKYLAVNTVIQNWDTYGRMTHNYYLYNNPDTGLLTWIPWDNNEALQTGNQQGSLPLNFSGLSTSSWPLIGYMYSDDVYRAKYDAYVKETVNNYFKTSDMQTLYTNYASLLESYATSEEDGYTFLNNSSDFQNAISTLKSHVDQRASAVSSYLN